MKLSGISASKLPGLAAERVAGITGLAVVHIPDHAAVLIVHLVFIVGVACDAGKFFIIAGDMAVAAVSAGMFSGAYRELVIENGLGPQ